MQQVHMHMPDIDIARTAGAKVAAEEDGAKLIDESL